jgi:hypothetical protein
MKQDQTSASARQSTHRLRTSLSFRTSVTSRRTRAMAMLAAIGGRVTWILAFFFTTQNGKKYVFFNTKVLL